MSRMIVKKNKKIIKMKNFVKYGLLILSTGIILSGCSTGRFFNNKREEKSPYKEVSKRDKKSPYKEVHNKKGEIKSPYKEVVKLIKKKGDKGGDLQKLYFNKNGVNYELFFFNLTRDLNIIIYKNKYYERFQDDNIDGIKNRNKDYYAFGIRGKEKITESSKMTDKKFQEISKKYDSLMINIPKWYEELEQINKESKNIPDKELNPLEKYVLQDKQLYKDFREFIKERGKKSFFTGGGQKYYYSSGWNYRQDRAFWIYNANYTVYNDSSNVEKKNFQVEKTEHREKITSFYDQGANGLNNEENDIVIYTYISKKSEIKKQVPHQIFSSFTPEKQDEIKEEYETFIKEIMHQANWKNY